MRAASPLTAFGVAAIGIAVYSAMDAIMKGLSIASGAYAAVLWRSLAGVALLAPVFVAQRRRWPSGAALQLHIARGAAGGASVVLFFWGLVRVPMAQGVALTFLSPLIALYLASATLGERLSRAALVGSGVASLGVLVIAAGEWRAAASTAHVLGSVAILIASVLYGGSLVLLRRQAQLADPLEVALFTSAVLSAMLLPGAPWLVPPMAAAQLPAIVGAAMLGSVSALALAWAYGRAEAQVLVPVEYTAFVWSALFGWLVFGEGVSAFTLGGAALIILGCLVAVRRRIAAAPVSEAAA